MADAQKTISDIIAEKRLRAAEMAKTLGDQHALVESLKDDADRIEAAWKREKFVIEADALAVGGIVGASHRGEAASIERIVRDAIVGYRELLAIAPNDEAEAELKHRAEIANNWLIAHGYDKEEI